MTDLCRVLRGGRSKKKEFLSKPAFLTKKPRSKNMEQGFIFTG
jgi:hypothetical protein